MKVRTPGGVEYEIPDQTNLFAEQRILPDPLDGKAFARVIQRLEYLLEEREVELEACHEQRHYVGQEVIQLERRLKAAEAKIEEGYETVTLPKEA